MTIWEHLDELRKRVTRAAIALFVSAGTCWAFHEKLFAWVARPYEVAWREHGFPGAPEFQTLGPADAFVGYLQLSLVGGVVIAIPVIFYQLWAFISPGLYSKEKRLIAPFVFFSSSLFVSGVLFAYYVAFPFTLKYFFSLLGQVDAAGTVLTQRPTLGFYLDFATDMFLAFGAVFELPLFISFLVLAGIVTPMQLLRVLALGGARVVRARRRRHARPGDLEPDRGERRAHGALLPLDRDRVHPPAAEEGRDREGMTRAVSKRAVLDFAPDDPRVRRWNGKPERADGDYVLYFCQAYRRAEDNAALAYAVDRANALGVPCVFYESIRCDHPYASDRFHTFAIECARDNATTCAARGLRHVFFLPHTRDEQRGVVRKLASRAALVVSDDFPGFVFDAHHASVASRAACAYVTIDDACVVPMALFPKQEYAARTIRPKLAKALPDWLAPIREPEPGSTRRRRGSTCRSTRWTSRRPTSRSSLRGCAIDHDVPPVEETRGGTREAERRLASFVRTKLASYAIDRNDPSRDGHDAPFAVSPLGRDQRAARRARRERGAARGRNARRRVERGAPRAAPRAARGSRSTSRRAPRTRRATTRSPMGARDAREARDATRGRSSTRATSKRRARPTGCGTRRSSSSARAARSTATRACSGASSSSRGPRSRATRTRCSSGGTTSRARRPRPRRLDEHRLVLRAARSTVAGARRFRHGARHVVERGASQARLRGVRRAVERVARRARPRATARRLRRRDDAPLRRVTSLKDGPTGERPSPSRAFLRARDGTRRASDRPSMS